MRYFLFMTTKEEVKAWLKTHKKTHSWLATKLDLQTKTVTNMLSKNGVLSGRVLVLIDSIMGKNTPAMFAYVSAKVEIGLTQEELKYYTKLAKSAGITVEDWIVSTIKYAGEHPEVIDEIIRQEQGKENTKG